MYESFFTFNEILNIVKSKTKILSILYYLHSCLPCQIFVYKYLNLHMRCHHLSSTSCVSTLRIHLVCVYSSKTCASTYIKLSTYLTPTELVHIQTKTIIKTGLLNKCVYICTPSYTKVRTSGVQYQALYYTYPHELRNITNPRTVRVQYTHNTNSIFRFCHTSTHGTC